MGVAKELVRKVLPESVWAWFRQRAKDILLWGVLPAAYRRACKKYSVDEHYVLFVEMNSDTLTNSMELVYKYLQSHNSLDLHFLSLQAHQVGFLKRSRNMIMLTKCIAQARRVFICEAMNMIACLPLRPETKVIQLWHGCGAFKRFGMSTAEKIFGDSRKEKLRHPYHTHTSLVTVSSPEVVWAYEEAMGFEGLPDIVRPLGVSRTDVFFDSAYLQTCRQKVLDAFPICVGKRVAVYLPTFRGRVATATAPDALDYEQLKEATGEDWILLVKHHPHVKKLPVIPKACADYAFDVTKSPLTTDDLMAISDACISDYSSLVFEYSLLEKPMAFFAFDLEEYDDWRGFYYSYGELTPGPICKTSEELADWLAHLDGQFNSAQVEEFRKRFMSSCDGHSTERICKAALAL